MVFTNEEFADILCCYRYFNVEAAAADICHEYLAGYSERLEPDISVFGKVYQQIRKIGESEIPGNRECRLRTTRKKFFFTSKNI